jgi:hypothetical protein
MTLRSIGSPPPSLASTLTNNGDTGRLGPLRHKSICGGCWKQSARVWKPNSPRREFGLRSILKRLPSSPRSLRYYGSSAMKIEREPGGGVRCSFSDRIAAPSFSLIRWQRSNCWPPAEALQAPYSACLLGHLLAAKAGHFERRCGVAPREPPVLRSATGQTARIPSLLRRKAYRRRRRVEGQQSLEKAGPVSGEASSRLNREGRASHRC